jgi:hypothetical protein
MLNKFWEGIGSELGKKWLTYLLEPTLSFWGIGLLAWVYSQDAQWSALTTKWNGLDEVGKVAVLVAAVLGLAASSALMHWLQRPLLRALEGYWPRWLRGLRQRRIDRVRRQLEKKQQRWQALRAQVRKHGRDVLRAVDRQAYVELDEAIVLRYPTDPKALMPTALGNRLRAAEDAPRHRYGLDSVVVWPHLWGLLPETEQSTLSEARGALDGAVRLIGWGGLMLLWLIWAWWALIPALLLILASWLRAVTAAEVYGDLLRAAFDRHRFALYESVRWPLPEDTHSENAHGERLTAYLYRGMTKEPVAFTHSRDGENG